MFHRRHASVWVLVLAAFVCSQTSGRHVFAAELKAGAAAVDITPQDEWPLPLIGSFSLRLADKAWDPLYARAVVLDDGETQLALVVIDSCFAPRELFDEAKRRASKTTGIPTSHMLTSATHTHSAPASRNRRELEADARYVERVTKGIAEAIEQAWRHREPAELGFGVAAVPEEVHNRRWFMKPGGITSNPFGGKDDIVRMNPPRGSELLDRPAGPIDPDVSVLSIRALDGRTICLYANYSLHYVGGVPAGGVSADYFGEFARLVEKRLTRESDSDKRPPIAILSNGTSGDVNNINFREKSPRAKPFERIRIVAKRVAEAALEAVVKQPHQRNLTLAVAQRELTLAKRRPTPAQVVRAKEFLAAEDESSLPRRAKPYARWTLQLAEPPHEETILLQAARIGDIGVTAIPCETFAEIGLRLKRESPLPRTFNVELANGHYGYLPTERQHAWGGYETWLGTCILEEKAAEKITKTLLELLAETAQ